MAYNELKISVAALALLVGGCVTDGLPSLDQNKAPQTVNARLGADITVPAWRVGDRWAYSDGYGLEVEAHQAGLTTFRRTDAREQWFSRRGFLRQDAQSATVKRSVVFRSIAAEQATTLVVGQPIVFTREFQSDGKTRVHNTSWIVEGRDTISVPAGDFETFMIVMRTRNAATGWTGFERWWYAPSVRHYVRMEYRYGDQPVGSRVLTSFEPGPEYAAEVPYSVP